LTLVFVGNVDATRYGLLKDIAARQVVRPFDLALNTGVYFKHNRIASAQPGAAPGVLAELVAGLERSLLDSGFEFDARPHVPHVTLLRDARRAPPLVIEPPLAWRVDALYLVRSQPGNRGVTYETVARSRQLAE
jgi:2'-5' RNA ligase